MPEKTVQKEPGKKPAPSKKPKPQQEVVVQISLSELHPFPDHPFQVREDASMQETAESVKEWELSYPLRRLQHRLAILIILEIRISATLPFGQYPCHYQEGL